MRVQELSVFMILFGAVACGPGLQLDQGWRGPYCEFRNPPPFQMYGALLALDAANPNADASGHLSGCPDGTALWKDLIGNIVTSYSGFGTCGSGSGWMGYGGSGDPFRMSFDGTDDYLTLSGPDSALTPSSFSIEVEFMVHKVSPIAQTIIGRFDSTSGAASGFQMHIMDGTLHAGVFEAVETFRDASSPVQQDQWNHAVLTYDSAKQSEILYLNGNMAAVNIGLTAYYATGGSSTVMMGAGRTISPSPGMIGNFLSGAIARLVLYDHSLQPEEVMQNFEAIQWRLHGWGKCE